jgi:DNA polymerase I-like protein with 3'-5' exonuclease and polymerase domains
MNIAGDGFWTQKVTVLDVETTIRAPLPHFGASPTYPTNWIVSLGYKHEDKEEQLYSKRSIIEFVHWVGEEAHLIVGHNLSFDLLYLMRYGLNLDFVNIWDTQKYNYISSGRIDGQVSLEQLAKKYRLPFKKDTEIKERFRAGLGADEIDQELLRIYLKSDVRVTSQIFEKQLEEYRNSEAMQEYILEMMYSLKVTTDMTYQGMKFNVEAAKEAKKDKTLLLEVQEERIQERWKDLYNFTNPNSSSQVATALWGGQVKVPVDVEVLGEDGEPIRYKSGDKKGQIKTKKGFSMETVQPLVSQDTIDLFNNRGWDKNASAQALTYIQKYDEGDAVEFAQDITGLRHINKTINTYYKPYIDFAVSETIHPTYNHCITQTGRLSSSKPNMQNMNNKEQL